MGKGTFSYEILVEISIGVILFVLCKISLKSGMHLDTNKAEQAYPAFLTFQYNVSVTYKVPG